jgi:hypothetical protein
MCFLDSCAVTSNVRLIMSAEIDEILGSNQWINVATLVPPVLSPLDISTLLASKAYESLRQHMQLRALGARRAKTNGSQLQKTSKRGRQPSHDEDKLDKDQVSLALQA